MYGLGQTLDLFLWILEAYTVRLNTSELGRFLSFSTEVLSSFKICVDFLIDNNQQWLHSSWGIFPIRVGLGLSV